MARRLFVLLGVVAVLLAGSAAPATAAERERDQEATQLALGDSVAFGFNPLLPFASAANFVGYPEIVARRLELDDVNASCPGEATGGFISATGTDNGCRPYRARFPLHVNYTTTQLAFAISFLQAHHRVRLVTIDIGANDFFVLQRQCQGDATCIGSGLPALLATVQANLELIFGQIRNLAHYHGTLVALTYYALAYDPATTSIGPLNQAIVNATLESHAIVADGFGAFRPDALAAGGSSCAAGLLVVLSPGRCDVHPSPKGRDLLARAVVRAVEGPDSDSNSD
jgi:lysophospholipase L1-like esterase